MIEDDELYTDEVWQELPTAEDEKQAQRYVRAYAYYQKEHASITAVFDAEISRIRDRMVKEQDKVSERMEFLTSALKYFYVATGAKRIILPDGTLSQRKQPERVVIEDEDTFVELAPGHLVVTKSAPDRTAIKQHIKDTGEIPTGVELVRSDPKFVISQ
jgi:hypothetical protein